MIRRRLGRRKTRQIYANPKRFSTLTKKEEKGELPEANCTKILKTLEHTYTYAILYLCICSDSKLETFYYGGESAGKCGENAGKMQSTPKGGTKNKQLQELGV